MAEERRSSNPRAANRRAVRVHGRQLGRFFHGYYREYCFLPLYIFCSHSPLCAKLRPADIDARAGSLKQVQKLVARLRQAWPDVVITLRADSGFCRDNLMSWCEANDVRYVFGLPKNQRLLKIIGREQQEAKLAFEQSGQASRVFADFTHRTQKSWSAARRVVGKAEHLSKGPNPRFIVTNIPAAERAARVIRTGLVRSRRDGEPHQGATTLSIRRPHELPQLRANQLRLWFSTLAYVVLNVVRDRGLKGTPLATARCDTIRTKLLKIGAAVTVTVRKVWVHLASACPYRKVFAHVWQNLRDWAPRLGSLPPSASLPPQETHRAATHHRNGLITRRHDATTRVRSPSASKTETAARSYSPADHARSDREP